MHMIIAVCCIVLPRVAVRCSVLQCVAVCCNVCKVVTLIRIVVLRGCHTLCAHHFMTELHHFMTAYITL